MACTCTSVIPRALAKCAVFAFAGDEAIHRERLERVAREVLTDPDEERALQDGHVLVGRVPCVAAGRSHSETEDAL